MKTYRDQTDLYRSRCDGLLRSMRELAEQGATVCVSKNPDGQIRWRIDNAPTSDDEPILGTFTVGDLGMAFALALMSEAGVKSLDSELVFPGLHDTRLTSFGTPKAELQLSV